MEILNLGLIDYERAVARQQTLVDDVSNGELEVLVFCQHPAVVTLGRGSQEGDVCGWSGSVVEASRGGRATYHGPSQLIVYPILDLKRTREGFKARDIHGYLRALENVICGSLRSIGIQDAEPRTVESEELSYTGVWVGKRKIASIGIAVRKWVTYHGCAINVDKDVDAFTGINPCGFQKSVMTSVEEILGVPSRESLAAALERHAKTAFALQTESSFAAP